MNPEGLCSAEVQSPSCQIRLEACTALKTIPKGLLKKTSRTAKKKKKPPGRKEEDPAALMNPEGLCSLQPESNFCQIRSEACTALKMTPKGLLQPPLPPKKPGRTFH